MSSHFIVLPNSGAILRQDLGPNLDLLLMPYARGWGFDFRNTPSGAELRFSTKEHTGSLEPSFFSPTSSGSDRWSLFLSAANPEGGG